MGHDIDIVLDCGEVVARTYISFNFTALGELYGCTPYEWQGKNSEEVSQICEKAIKALESEKIVCPVPDEQSSNWGWNATKEVYMFHIIRIKAEADQLSHYYPSAKWYSDQVFTVFKPEKRD